MVVWERQAETCNTYLKKGSLVYVEGSPAKPRQWQDQQGQTRYTTEIRAQRIQFLDTRRGQQGGQQYDGDDYQPQGRPQQGGYQQPPQGQPGYGGPQDQGYDTSAPQQGPGGGGGGGDDQGGPIFPSEIDQMPF